MIPDTEAQESEPKCEFTGVDNDAEYVEMRFKDWVCHVSESEVEAFRRARERERESFVFPKKSARSTLEKI